MKLTIGERALILRRRMGLPVKDAAQMFGRSEFWVRKVERDQGTSYKREQQYLDWLTDRATALGELEW